ncbi:MAG: PD-(D/E)XK nuclease family protein, partial [Planctomycetota bacterium]|nr:PD-(D/E)XK nuclease family protein [Planctomycetota bacterium]
WGKHPAPSPATSFTPSVAAGQAWSADTVVRGDAPPRVLPRWTASHVGKEEAITLPMLTTEPREDARPRGIAIHRLFEEIEWLEEFEGGKPDDDALLGVLHDLDDPPSEDQAREWIGNFRSILAKPHVREALTRPAGIPPDQLTVWRERRFALRLSEPGRSEPAILRGSFDRVVLIGPRGSPTSATILDFKTGEVPDRETERLKREAYEPQMKEYRRALAAMLGGAVIPIESDLCFVDRAG